MLVISSRYSGRVNEGPQNRSYGGEKDTNQWPCYFVAVWIIIVNLTNISEVTVAGMGSNYYRKYEAAFFHVLQ